ncbi:MAG: selenide, water dikinase SelD [Lachnospiraceae bacterium]
METDIKLTKLASCAGCGAKVGAGTLASMLEGFKTHTDKRLIVGYDKSDDASVFLLDEETALVQTLDFFPPITDDPFLYGQIAATNSLSDVYAMGGTPKLALNILCLRDGMSADIVQEILRGGYSKAYEADTIITGGHTIHGAEPLYGLSVSGFVHPKKVLTNSGAKPGDLLILTKPLGVGILTTAAKADLADASVMERLYRQMSTLNKEAAQIMIKYDVHSCTDVTGFALLGHSFEMAQGSRCSIHLYCSDIPYHKEAYEFAEMGFIPAGAYRNRDYAGPGIEVSGNISRAMQDILYDPQTSGGLLISVSEKDAYDLLHELTESGVAAKIIGEVTEYRSHSILLKE